MEKIIFICKCYGVTMDELFEEEVPAPGEPPEETPRLSARTLSSELMSLYAANNIAKGVKRFAMRGGVRLGGIIGNGRNTPNEQQLLQEFAKRLHTQLIAFIPRDVIVNKAENNRQTVLQYAPESAQAGVYRKLAHDIWHNENMAIPTPMSFEELEKLVAEYGN